MPGKATRRSRSKGQAVPFEWHFSPFSTATLTAPSTEYPGLDVTPPAQREGALEPVGDVSRQSVACPRSATRPGFGSGGLTFSSTASTEVAEPARDGPHERRGSCPSLHYFVGLGRRTKA